MKCPRCFQIIDTGDDDMPKGMLCDECVVEKAAVVPPLDVEAVFGKGGPLSAGNPNYEARAGQVALSRAIFDALAGKHHLLAEGPCGIGKSKAYGVPAAYLASQGKKVIIVTASIALQEQLIKKDLPALQAELPWKFSFALMKGKANYLCQAQHGIADASGLMGNDLEDYRTVEEWAEDTITGDKSELLIKPSDLVWGRFSTSSDACPGKKCEHYRTCHAIKARDNAAHAGILVTNYHLFFLNMSYGGTLLPAADVVIFDEAHEATDIARDLLGFRITSATFRRYAKDAEKRNCADIGANIREAADAFFGKLLRFAESGHYNKLVRFPLPLDPSNLVQCIEEYARVCAKSHLVDHALAAARRVKETVAIADENVVYSLEVKSHSHHGKSVAIVARFVSPAPVLSSQLWGGYDSVVAVSATITTDGRFDFQRGELGAPKDAREIMVETPFNFGHQALLVVPQPASLPEPNAPEFGDVAARAVIDTIEACGGRTLALFTSYKALNHVYERVVRAVGGRYTILRQGDAPPSVLAERFKKDTRSVLLGTSSFWTGVDVPGEALTGLVIDRLPFGSPDDPVSVRLNESNPRAFAEYTTPRAILTFRQGIGRLIRSQRDVGCIVVLDKRLSTKGYGKRFLTSLPQMSRASSTAAISSFLRAKGVAA
jgi:ATP-dependent DNA helicase DinG